jgi:sugar lactone lactonase YvrE
MGQVQQHGRYFESVRAAAATGYRLERLTPVSQLFNANGLRTGADGRVYVAQGIGSQISAVNVDSGVIEVISPKGGDIVGPDDLAFDAHGNLFVTEVMDGRVSVRDSQGRVRVLRDDLPNANGITFHRERLFIDECRQGGRLLELDLNGGAPRILLENLPMPNALAPGPDGYLYFPLLEANEIWRVHPETAKAERVVGDLGVPDAVKFDSKGYIVSTQVGTGEVLRIDPQSGERTVIARLDPGLDNLTFVGDRVFVSHLIDGRITELLAGGGTRAVVGPSLNWPLGLSVGPDQTLYIADGFSFYSMSHGDALRALSNSFDPTAPHGMRGVTATGEGLFVTTWSGVVAKYLPWAKQFEVLAEGLDEPYGIALLPDGACIVAEGGTGRVLKIAAGKTTSLCSGLKKPKGIAVAADGGCYISEADAGRVSKLSGASSEVILEGLKEPQGIALHNGALLVLDVGAQTLIRFDLHTRERRAIATNLPVGTAPGVVAKPLRGVPWFCGPLGSCVALRVMPSAHRSTDYQGVLT